MFNLLGILLAVLIASMTHGQGVLVGWESIAAAGAGAILILLFHNSVASHVVDRWHLIRLRLQAAEMEGLAAYAEELRAEREMLARRLPAFRLSTDALIIGFFLAQCLLFGWPDYVRDVMGVPEYLDLLPSLLPYFAMLAASWVGQWRMERVVRGTDMRAGRYVGFQVRANLMTIAPIVLIYAAYWAVMRYVPMVDDLQASFKFLGFAVQIALVLLISIFLPAVIRLVLPGGPMPEGRLRRRLETFARDRGLRINQIIVWRTGSRMFATAFVIGLLSPFRYVFITDALLKRMNEDEILAVFAHEMGHVHHRHLWWLLAFLISFSVVMLGLTEGLTLLAGGLEYELLAFGAALAYGYFAFGYVSRRFERQADAFAARHTSPELLAGVFLKLGQANPVAMKRDGWRHFSLERRVRELVVVRTHPEVKRIFRAELMRGMAIAAVATLTGMLLLAQPVRDDVISGLATYSLTQYDRARARGADEARVAEWRERTLQRTDAMGRLSGDYERHALWYQGIVAGLSGERTDSFDRLIAETEAELARTPPGDRRHQLTAQSQFWRASKPSVERAREKGTAFFDELDVELKRK